MSNTLRLCELVTLLDRASASKNIHRYTISAGQKHYVGPGPFPKGGLHHDPEEFDINCSEYFRAVGRQLALHCRLGPEWSQELNANQLADRIASLAKIPDSGWTHVENEAKVQGMANEGCLLVGVYRNPNYGRSGHVAVVFPVLPDVHAHQIPPLVRDGNEHLRGKHLFPGTWGAIGRVEAFGHNPVKWYCYHLGVERARH
ncbi:MAG: hypothetical protein ACLQVL_17580 [Terriglobia bacterium]